MMERKDKTLLLALGNDILGDDGLALKLVSDLQKRIRSPELIFDTSMTGGIEIIEKLSAHEQVIILDSIKTMDGIPGTVYHFTPEDFNETLHISSFHDVSFLTALKFAEYIQMQLPDKIDIVAVEIIEDMRFTQNLSPEIRRKYPKVFQEVLMIISDLVATGGYRFNRLKRKKKLSELNLE